MQSLRESQIWEWMNEWSELQLMSFRFITSHITYLVSLKLGLVIVTTVIVTTSNHYKRYQYNWLSLKPVIISTGYHYNRLSLQPILITTAIITTIIITTGYHYNRLSLQSVIITTIIITTGIITTGYQYKRLS